MDFNYLTASEMAAASGFLLNEQLPMLEALDETRALVPGLRKAHVGVLEVVGAGSGEAADAALTQQLSTLDAQHDALVRAIYFGIESAIHTTRATDGPDTGEAQSLEQVRDALFPEGLSATVRPYLVEAGMATCTVAQLSPAVRAVLEGVPAYGNRTMLELVLRWGEVGGQLGRLLQTRTQGEAMAADLPTINQARAIWKQKFSTLEVVLGSVDGHEREVAALLLTLSSAVEAAVARAKSRKATAKSAESAAAAAPAAPSGGSA